MKKYIFFVVLLVNVGCVSTGPLNCQTPISTSKDGNYYYVVTQIPKQKNDDSIGGDQSITTTSNGKIYLVNNSPYDIKIGPITLHPGKSVELTTNEDYQLGFEDDKFFKDEIMKKKLYINKRSDSIWVIERTLRE